MWFSDCIDLVLLDRPRRRKRNRRKPLRLVLPRSFFSLHEDDDDSPTAGPLTLTVSAPGELISLPPRLHCTSTGQSMVLRLCVVLVVARWVSRRRRWGFKGAGVGKNSWSACFASFLCVSHPLRRVIKTQFNILLSSFGKNQKWPDAAAAAACHGT